MAPGRLTSSNKDFDPKPAYFGVRDALLAGQLCDPELTPAARATMEELQRRFEDAIEQLNEHDREVVLMRHFEKLSNSEVAKALDLAPPAASMRYLRAVRRLRSILAEGSSAS